MAASIAAILAQQGQNHNFLKQVDGERKQGAHLLENSTMILNYLRR